MALTAIQVKEAKSHDKDLKISDGEGMYLQVKVNASKYWRMDYRFAGKRRTYAIVGTTKEISGLLLMRIESLSD